jgi:MFS family permease
MDLKTPDNSEVPSAWSIKNFRLYTYAGILLPFAAQVQSLIVGWQIYEIKHDPLYLGLIGLTEAAPALSLAFITGYIVDRSSPLLVFKNVVRLALFSALMLVIISNPWHPFTPDQRLPFIYAAAFLAGVGRAFRAPAVTSLIPRLVPRNVLHVSSAWNASGFNIASAMGPALGGFLFAWKGAPLPYTLDFSILIIAVGLVSLIKIDETKNLNPKSTATSFFFDLTLGLRYVFQHPLLLSALALDMFAVLFGGAVAMLPIYAAEILFTGPTGLGILRSAPAAGSLLMSLFLIRYPVNRHAGRILLGCVAGFGFCMIAFGLSRLFWLSAFLLFLGGSFDSVSVVIRSAIVQLSSPPEIRGRIGAVNSVFIGISNQLGEFESGVAAKLLGLVPSVVVGGIVTLVIVGFTTVKTPKLRRMDLTDLR